MSCSDFVIFCILCSPTCRTRLGLAESIGKGQRRLIWYLEHMKNKI